MIKIGKPISKTLLARTFIWKRQVHSQNRIHAKRMLEDGNHSEVLHCLLCGNLTSLYLQVDSVAYGHCNLCNHLQSSIRPSLAFLQSLYGSNEDNYSSQDLAYVNLPQIDLDARVNEIATPKVEWIKNSIEFNPGDLWLDIGSGTGDTLVAAKSFGFSVIGIETSPSEIHLAESRSISTIDMFFDGNQKITQMDSAKVISIFNVLEHALNPIDFLSSISNQMSLGAYLVIEVPRLDSLSSIVQGAYPKNIYRHIFSPEHLNIFSDKSIGLLLSQLSFALEATWYFGSDAIEIFGHISGLMRPDFDGGLDEYSESINLLQEQIDKVGLSDVMLLIARKV